jgi:hypothetical protein
MMGLFPCLERNPVSSSYNCFKGNNTFIFLACKAFKPEYLVYILCTDEDFRLILTTKACQINIHVIMLFFTKQNNYIQQDANVQRIYY